MKPLLDIQTVPIAIEYKTTSAQVTRVAKPNPNARAQAAKPVQPVKKNTAPVKRGAPRPKVDTVDLNNRGIARVTPRKPAQATVSFYDAQGNSRVANYDATARMTRDGQIMVDLQLSQIQAQDTAAQTPADSLAVSDVSMLEGATAADVPETLSLTYELEKMQYDMRQSGEGFEFTPASIEFSILEYPRVLIEYIGSPMYVPPSADPNYEPIDVEV